MFLGVLCRQVFVCGVILSEAKDLRVSRSSANVEPLAVSVALRRLRTLAVALVLILPLPAQRNGTAPRDWAERDQWQRPAEVMDTLRVQPGSRVADVGAGSGYFTMHLAERVGGQGKVYAVDVDKSILAELRDTAKHRNLPQVEVVQGAPDDPHLPPDSLDAVLVVNAYHEFHHHDAMLQAIRRALQPGGLLGIIDKDAAPGETRDAYESRHRLPAAFARKDLEANGFTAVHDQNGFDPSGERSGEHWWFLVAARAK